MRHHHKGTPHAHMYAHMPPMEEARAPPMGEAGYTGAGLLVRRHRRPIAQVACISPIHAHARAHVCASRRQLKPTLALTGPSPAQGAQPWSPRGLQPTRSRRTSSRGRSNHSSTRRRWQLTQTPMSTTRSRCAPCWCTGPAMPARRHCTHTHTHTYARLCMQMVTAVVA